MIDFYKNPPRRLIYLHLNELALGPGLLWRSVLLHNNSNGRDRSLSRGILKLRCWQGRLTVRPVCVEKIRLDLSWKGGIGPKRKHWLIGNKVSYVQSFPSLCKYSPLSHLRGNVILDNAKPCESIRVKKKAPRFDSKIKEENLEEKFPDWGISAPASIAGFSSPPSRAAAVSW